MPLAETERELSRSAIARPYLATPRESRSKLVLLR